VTSRIDAKIVRCPECNAWPGQNCFSRTGKFRASCHRSRHDVAKGEGHLNARVDKLETLVESLTPKAAIVPVKMAEGVYLVSYEARDPSWVFVPDPAKRGRFCRVPRAFLLYKCPACHALPGQPCHNPKHGTSWSGQTGHADRTYSGQFPHRIRVPPIEVKYDDRLLESALVALSKIVRSEGFGIQVNHLRGCKHAKKGCTCGYEMRKKALEEVMRAQPKLDRLS